MSKNNRDSDACGNVEKKKENGSEMVSAFKAQEDFDFEYKEDDNVREKFEIIGIKMDIHKNGILYLKELVHI